MTREELNQGRHEYNPHRVYGYKHSYCKLTDIRITITLIVFAIVVLFKRDPEGKE